MKFGEMSLRGILLPPPKKALDINGDGQLDNLDYDLRSIYLGRGAG
jgi:hypothetical protein